MTKKTITERVESEVLENWDEALAEFLRVPEHKREAWVRRFILKNFYKKPKPRRFAKGIRRLGVWLKGILAMIDRFLENEMRYRRQEQQVLTADVVQHLTTAIKNLDDTVNSLEYSLEETISMKDHG